jgi:hypothetical protein
MAFPTARAVSFLFEEALPTAFQSIFTPEFALLADLNHAISPPEIAISLF